MRKKKGHYSKRTGSEKNITSDVKYAKVYIEVKVTEED